MLRGNLATRPFYNERLVRVLLVAALASAAAWAAVNVATVVSLSQQGAMLADRVRGEGLAASAARADAEALRTSLNPAEIAAASRAATEANQLIVQRTFSWTTLFNRVEATLPPDVRLVQVQPQADDDGRMMVSLTVVSRRIEDLDAGTCCTSVMLIPASATVPEISRHSPTRSQASIRTGTADPLVAGA